VVIAVIAVMAAIAIPIISGVPGNASAATAKRNLAYINSAVQTFNQSQYELTNAESSGTDDETAIRTNLIHRDVTSRPGSPYLPTHITFHYTSDTNKYRAIWNGRLFELVSPGESANGIDLMRLQETR